MVQNIGSFGAARPVYSSGMRSSENTTTEALAGSATYTGTAEQNDSPDVGVSCKTDQAGTLFFDFSNDGQNFDTFPSAGFAVAPNIHEFHTAVKLTRFFRIRLVNDSTTAQTFLRLYTYYGTFRPGNAPLNQPLGSDADALVVRSVDPVVDSALGRLGGVQERNKFGYVDGVGTAVQLADTGSWIDLWYYGGLRTSPTTSFTPYQASTSAADTGIPITYTYQDTGGDELTVTVETNGQTPVSLGVTATEVYRGVVDDDTYPVGDITCVRDTGGYSSGTAGNNELVLTAIPVNDAQTQVLAFRVPADKQAILTRIIMYVGRASGAAGSADIVLQVREPGKVFRTIRAFHVTQSVNDDLTGTVLPAGTDVRVRIRDVSDNGTSISGDVHYLLVDQ